MNETLLRRIFIVLLIMLMLLAAIYPITAAFAEVCEKYEITDMPHVIDSQTSLSSAAAYALIEQSGGKILKSSNENSRLPMASTTKTMTALVVLENCQLDEMVNVPNEAVGTEGSSMYLKYDEIISVEDLLYGLMLLSGNDAAVALAVHVGGSVEDFVKLMNEKAEARGLTDTHFVTPNWLHDDMHYTTAI